MSHTYESALGKAAHDLMVMKKGCHCGELTAYEFVRSANIYSVEDDDELLRSKAQLFSKIVWSDIATGVVLDHYEDEESTKANADELRFELACALDALRSFNSPVMRLEFDEDLS